MTERIVLLPHNIANQIAAGEVIQRPGSAVKELLENAVDAGATEIRLIIRDAGKALIQVIDNGSGMGLADARRCFERHATSKIRNIEDLFNIRTMGFRGEALASVAAVAQVELKTRQASEATGHYLEVENSRIIKEEAVATPVGTSLAMKNLFFNIPARRNFLKSNAAEMRHIVDEFTRVAMAFPQVLFTLTSNGEEIFYLEAGSAKQRVVQLLGATYNSKLVPVREETDYLNISGFVGKPETAKKTRGDQYFFVNNRFIRSAYLNHALMNAFQDMIPADSFPLYVLFIDLDPTQVDVNVHPTKQEIKFEDEKIIYAFVQAAIKHALAQYNIRPALDFDLDAGIQQLSSVQQPFTDDRRNAASSTGLFQGFVQKNQAHFIERDRTAPGVWRDKNVDDSVNGPLDASDASSGGSGLPAMPRFEEPGGGQTPVAGWQEDTDQPGSGSSMHHQSEPEITQILNTYLVYPNGAGFLLIHQQSAHERVRYETMKLAAEQQRVASQHSLFPATLELSPADAVILGELLPDLKMLGFLVEPAGNNNFVIQGTPADVETGNERYVLDILLEQFKHFSPDVKFSKREKLIRSLARQQSVKAGTRLTDLEIRTLVSDLFRCQVNSHTPDGSPIFHSFDLDQLERMFGR